MSHNHSTIRVVNIASSYLGLYVQSNLLIKTYKMMRHTCLLIRSNEMNNKITLSTPPPPSKPHSTWRKRRMFWDYIYFNSGILTNIVWKISFQHFNPDFNWKIKCSRSIDGMSAYSMQQRQPSWISATSDRASFQIHEVA